MKNLILSILVLVPSLAFAEPMAVTVEGMTCGSCQKKVEKALRKLPGVESVKADADTGKVVLQIAKDAKKPTVSEIAKATKGAGFRLLTE